MEFPQDFIAQILALLPVKSLLRFQCLSKPWFALIRDPHYFIHLKNPNNDNNRENILIAETFGQEQKKDFFFLNIISSNEEQLSEPVSISPPFFRQENLHHTSVVGCCNSLICITSYCITVPSHNYEIVIWNPSIKKYKRLPPIKHPAMHLNFAFGHDPVNNDYKVLMIEFVWINDRMKALRIMVYSLKALSWRRVEDRWPYKDSISLWSEPTFLNGAFHWLISTTQGTTLLAFDLTTEKFRVQTHPLSITMVLGVLGGSLCASGFIEATDNAVWGNDVWMMKEYGVVSSWSRLYHLPMTLSCRDLAQVLLKDGEKVLMTDHTDTLFWYDINKKTCRIADVKVLLNIMEKRYWIMSCAESLLLLDDGDSDN
ncbi:F-box protein CPR1-like [Corylus avellana]|uniref:F-box protein CPR1-like n=1 Tax=Corylus avellana TaxID=13451 RepID=UPI00286CC427|nr:F-box protein CPR1-like [Corylus avellana]